MHVYLDGSYSMAGFVRGVTPTVRPHEDLLAILDSFATARRVQPSYARFGVKVAAVPATGIRDYAKASAYECRGCDNQESRIDEVLKLVKRPANGRLTLVVTDLWLSSTAYSGSPQVALGGPLTEILSQGRSVGVMGVRAPYAGRIPDLSKKNRGYEGVRERPLFILAIGSEADVSAFHTALVQSGSPSFAQGRMKFSLFAPQSGNPWRAARNAPLRAEGLGAVQGAALSGVLTPGIQQFRFRPARGGRITTVMDAQRGVAQGAVWSGPLTGSTKVWLLRNAGAFKRCKLDAWTPYSPLSGAWTTIRGKPTTAQFALTPASAAVLAPGKTYLISAYLGARQLESPNPANGWMRDWSFTADQEDALVARRTAFFKVLNLDDLAANLEAAVDRAAPPTGRVQAATTFMVKVER